MNKLIAPSSSAIKRVFARCDMEPVSARFAPFASTKTYAKPG